MKRLINIFGVISLLGLFALQACQSKNKKWVLEGTCEKPVSQVYLFRFDQEMKPELVDSSSVSEGSFLFSGINPTPDLESYLIAMVKRADHGTDVLLGNGDHQIMVLRDQFKSEFSGTPQSETMNTYYSMRQREFDENLALTSDLTDLRIDQEVKNQKMTLYREKMQEIENEKIDFLRSINHPQLNSHLVLKEVLRSGIVEKEVFRKYLEALTAEGALTDNGIKVHRIYEVFDAYALSIEMSFLDTTTIKQRYNQLNEECKSSEYARKVEEHLIKSGAMPTTGNTR